MGYAPFIVVYFEFNIIYIFPKKKKRERKKYKYDMLNDVRDITTYLTSIIEN